MTTPDECVRLEARLAEAPDDFDGWLELARSRNVAHQGSEAWAAANNALTLRPGHLEALYEKGMAELELGFTEAAASAFTSILAVQPLHPNVLLSLGSAYYQLRRLDVASVVWEQAVRVGPAPLDTLENLAVCYQRLGNFEKVAETWGRVLAREPRHPLALHHLAALGRLPVPDRTPDDYVVKLFDEFAVDFDSTLNSLNYEGPRLLTEIIAQHSPNPPANLRILDAGCGTGLCAPYLRPWASKLEGVDLSRGMLEKARERNLYDALHCDEMTRFFAGHVMSFNLIVAGDSFNYFGTLEPIARSIAGSLVSGGRCAFFVEKIEAETLQGFCLERHGRYAHRAEYVVECLATGGLHVLAQQEATVRFESGRPVLALFFLTERY